MPSPAVIPIASEAITPTTQHANTNFDVAGTPNVTGVVGAPRALSPSTSRATPDSVKPQSVTHIISPRKMAGKGSIVALGSDLKNPAGSKASQIPMGTSPYAIPTGTKLKNVMRLAKAEYTVMVVTAKKSTTSDSGLR